MYRQTEIGQEKLCPRCNEWWPADAKFFYPGGKGVNGTDGYCIRCRVVYMREYRPRQREYPGKPGPKMLPVNLARTIYGWKLKKRLALLREGR